MQNWLAIAALTLLGILALGMLRVLWGPSAADRMIAAQLIGSTGVGILLLLAHALSVPALIDVALVLALLAAVTVAAFVGRYRENRND
ncbi:MAG: monovalent cation/H+ antiporter complex subunit F [Gammaproteobacteria bacterium]